MAEPLISDVNAETLALVKRFEGWARALSDGRAAPYLCPAGVWTLGWGSTRGLDGKAVTPASEPVTPEQGESLLARDLAMAGASVRRLVGVPLTPGQYGALCSFVYNLGAGRLKASTLLRRLNEGAMDEAADEFPKWVMAGGRVLPGLQARRQAERALFLTVEAPRVAAAEAAAVASPGRLGRFMSAFRRAAA
ncbi:lysozyme [Acetobacteraceae bacterium H6797]|nr:lysozyme [Acetobacteraceae bacterium H6797]